MKKISLLINAGIALLTLTAAAQPAPRIGLKCVGETRFDTGGGSSRSEEHYVVDRGRRLLVQRDPYTGRSITSYALKVNSTFYSGERQEDGRTNGGFYVHHYETVQISREDGSINSSSLSTTSFPNGPTTREMTFTGKCVQENPDARKSPKF